MSDPIRFDVSIEGDYRLTIEDVWPDGDAPENPTADDVAEVMRKCGSRSAVLCDWGLEPTVVVYSSRGAERAEVWS